ncbi:hypothetical protein GCM10007973_28110 [Polymorphobacter multimanifer]|nr:hypothetical protein GCM10007973_28110 [Polymorphobacter multimanifer]
MCPIVLPYAASTGPAAANAPSAPPHMTDKLPDSAPAWPPETGASSHNSPRAAACSSRCRATSAEAVVWSMNKAPARIPENAPPPLLASPTVTASTSASAPTHAATTSAPLAASAGLVANRPP